MHSHGLIHRDLKPCNIFLHGELTAPVTPDPAVKTSKKRTGPLSHHPHVPPKLHVKVGVESPELLIRSLFS